jgi:hypothetical protein
VTKIEQFAIKFHMPTDQIETALFGYATTTLAQPVEFEGTEGWSAHQWQHEYERSSAWIQVFIAARDPYVVLARTAFLHLLNGSNSQIGPVSSGCIEQAEVELTQALLLFQEQQPKAVPTSPQNFVRYWTKLRRHVRSFIQKQTRDYDLASVEEEVQRTARLQTLCLRNLFTRANCEAVTRPLLARMDQSSEEAFGFKIKDVFEAMFHVTDLVATRAQIFTKNIHDLRRANNKQEIQNIIDFFVRCYPLAEAVWRKLDSNTLSIEHLRYAGLQLSELAYPWIFTVDKATLDDKFCPKIVSALFSRAIPIGGLAGDKLEHIYLNNPVWKKPYVFLNDRQLFVPLCLSVYSFPFLIIEDLIGTNTQLKRSYETARAKQLEAEVISLLAVAMPSADIFTNVIWTDPDTGKEYENDVVAFLGNCIFVFEIKSGRIQDVARRGGKDSLKTHFRELYIEPGLQGWRLQNYLDRYCGCAVLRRKQCKSIIQCQIDRPKAIYRYSVCFENFTNIASSKHFLKHLGLLDEIAKWAPLFTLGDLQLMSQYLDSELSFQHYLTRRQNVDDVINFNGDEKDILSIYLTNGLWMDAAKLGDERISFAQIDGPVRQKKVPRLNRTEADLVGPRLPPLWLAITREIYRKTDQRHRFDIVNAILNQGRPDLAFLEKTVRRFRRGVRHNGDDVMVVKYDVGARRYILACYLAKSIPMESERESMIRGVAMQFKENFQFVECAAFIFLRRSKQDTFDSVSFGRYGFKPE